MIKKNIVIFAAVLILLTLVWPQAAYAATNIRVLLGSEAASLSAAAYLGGYTVMDQGLNLAMAELDKGDTVKVTRVGNKYQVKINDSELGTAVGTVALLPDDEDKSVFSYGSGRYRGILNFAPGANSGILAVDILDIEAYLYGVVGNEIGYNIENEALKAQAVVSRSYALACRNPASAYDVKNSSYSQTYGGYNAESVSGAAGVRAAVDATAGQVIYYKDPAGSKPLIVKAYFHANSGGHTEDIENVWGSSPYPIRGVPSPYDSYAVDFSQKSGQSWPLTQYQWQVQYTPAEIAALAESYSGKDIGVFKELNTYRSGADGGPSSSGRVTKIEIVGSKGTVTAVKDAVRTALGGLKSSLFEIVTSAMPFIKGVDNSADQAQDFDSLYAVGKDKLAVAINGASDSYYVVGSAGKVKLSKTAGDDIIISGKGTGHGVGMSQWGARGMANAGKSYREIIAYYYFGDPVNKNFYLGSL